jgi:hypothetical protein
LTVLLNLQSVNEDVLTVLLNLQSVNEYVLTVLLNLQSVNEDVLTVLADSSTLFPEYSRLFLYDFLWDLLGSVGGFGGSWLLSGSISGICGV